jgi:acyl-coenzyme A synthetase/AMP-(fatty) acid ligase
LIFLGRLDNQVKIRGYRVELQEIDSVLRGAAKTDQAVAVAWPLHEGAAEGVVAFVCANGTRDEVGIRAHCKRLLPDYAVPKHVYFLERMPLNLNGKIDRRRLVATLEENDHNA